MLLPAAPAAQQQASGGLLYAPILSSALRQQAAIHNTTGAPSSQQDRPPPSSGGGESQQHNSSQRSQGFKAFDVQHEVREASKGLMAKAFDMEDLWFAAVGGKLKMWSAAKYPGFKVCACSSCAALNNFVCLPLNARSQISTAENSKPARNLPQKSKLCTTPTTSAYTTLQVSIFCTYLHHPACGMSAKSCAGLVYS